LTGASQSVTVSAPALTLPSSPLVGSGLQTPSSGSLGATNYGTTTVRVESSNPAVALVAPNATTAGTAFIDIPLTAPTGSFTFYVQGVEGQTGTVTFTASAPGFTDATTTVTVRAAGQDLVGLPASTTSLSPNTAFTVRIGVLNAAGTGLSGTQPIRAGGTPLTVTVTNSQATVAQLVTSALTGQSVTATIGVGQSQTPGTVATGGMAFDPLSSGTTTVTSSIPGVVALPGATRTVIVN
ncbi:MAG: hypothetical protein OEW06_15695, partial [Gemmatimonadota bacterium]|nr:hypothetical protein [Gemmatimonadota bacterium]